MISNLMYRLMARAEINAKINAGNTEYDSWSWICATPS